MASYYDLFAQGDFKNDVPGADPTLAFTPSVDATPWYQNKDMIRMLAVAAGQIGSGLSQGKPVGQVLGDVVSRMGQAGGMSQALSNVKAAAPAPSAPVPQATPAQGAGVKKPEEATPAGNMAKQFADYSKVLKIAAGLDRNIAPDGFKTMLLDAFEAKPELAPPTPTQTTGSAPTAPAAPVAAQSPAPATTGQSFVTAPMSETAAMALDPGQVAGVYNFAKELGAQDIDRAKVDVQRALADVAKGELGVRQADVQLRREQQIFEQDPTRIEEKIKVNTAPVLAQIDVLQKTQQFNMDNLNNLKAQSPAFFKMKVPGSDMTIGQYADLAVTSPAAANNLGQIVQQTISYNASIESAKIHAGAAALNAKTASEQTAFNKMAMLFEKYNNDIAKYEGSYSQEEYAKLPKETQSMLLLSGKMPRPAGMEDSIKQAYKARDEIGSRLFGPAYLNIKTANTAAPVNIAELRAGVPKRTGTVDFSSILNYVITGGATAEELAKRRASGSKFISDLFSGPGETPYRPDTFNTPGASMFRGKGGI